MAKWQDAEKKIAEGTSSTDSTALFTQIVPFDGRGRDPSTLVGHKVQWYCKPKQPPRLVLMCASEVVQFHKGFVFKYRWDPNYDGLRHQIRMDDNLLQALHTLPGKPDKSLTIVEAVVGQRYSKVTQANTDAGYRTLRHSHRVIGIRLERMKELGYISARSDSDVEHQHKCFYDVILGVTFAPYVISGGGTLNF